MEEEKSLSEHIIEIKKLLEEQDKSKAKNFVLPWKAKVGKAKVRKNWATLCYINDNKEATFKRVQIDEQTTLVDGSPRLARPSDMLTYKGKPFIIQPSWSVEPFSPSKNQSETEQKQMSSNGYKLLLNKMKKEVISTKKQISGVVVFVIIVVIIGLGYMAVKGGMFSG